MRVEFIALLCLVVACKAGTKDAEDGTLETATEPTTGVTDTTDDTDPTTTPTDNSTLAQWCRLQPAQVDCAAAGTSCATTCEHADVLAAFDTLIAAGGGILYIPAGQCTWDDGDYGIRSTTDVEFFITGAGRDETVIDYHGNYCFDFLVGSMDTGAASGFRGLANATFNGHPDTAGYGSRLIGARTNDHAEVCVHDLKTTGWGHVGRLTGFLGVVHSNDFGPPSMNNTTAPANQNSYGFYVEGDGGWAGYSSSQPDFGSRDWIFFEDNTWLEYSHELAGFCSSKFVFRGNTVSENDGPLDTHDPGYNSCWHGGGDAGTMHAGRAYEIYNNTFHRDELASDAIDPRSGSGLIYDNQLENFNNGVQVSLESHSDGPRCRVADGCQKDFDYDNGNCTDADDGCCEAPNQVWIWNNACTNVNDCFEVERGHECMREGEEYYLREPSPAEVSYTPFTYPHPLR